MELVAASATACGALGCHEKENLIKVNIDGNGQKVVCNGHLKNLLQREVSL